MPLSLLPTPQSLAPFGPATATMLIRLDTVRQSVVPSSRPLLESALQTDAREQRKQPVSHCRCL